MGKEERIMTKKRTDAPPDFGTTERRNSQYGKLKIFLGYAAGVGKTYAMLSEAHAMRGEGVDVVAGYIEAHARPETTALLAGLEAIPPLEAAHKGVRLKEFDLDTALARKPRIILIDELAHTNAQTCRHKKRYQDVEELLRAGIDVYTTVNVQHIESLHDMVAAITGVSVRERIPDSVFDSADQVELVDIDPAELIWRLEKGKIYRAEQAERALNNFFTKEKLVALREIALRKTADRVNQAAAQAEPQIREKDYYTREHILVCVSPSPTNAKVIRTAARMTSAFHGAFTALYVETSANRALPEKGQALLRDNMRLAEQLGAQVATVFGDDVSEQIAEYAKASRVSKIVMGRSGAKKGLLAKVSYVDRLTALSPNMDVYIIPDAAPNLAKKWTEYLHAPAISLADIAKTAAVLLLSTLVGLWFESLGFGEANMVTVYILGVLLTATLTRGRFCSVVSSIGSVLLFNYFFTEPRLTLQAYGAGYPAVFAIMLLAAIVTSSLTTRVKQQAGDAARKAMRTEVLLETNRKLQLAKGQTEILSATARQLIRLLDRTVIFYTATEDALSGPMIFPRDAEPAPAGETDYLSGEERAVAEWVYKNNKHAGATTNTLSAAKCLYLAVRGSEGVLAVAGFALRKDAPLEAFEKNLTVAILGDCALALEKERSAESEREVSLQIRNEHLRANLLRAISHDLRTPLTSISGNAGILMTSAASLAEPDKQELYAGIYDDAEWLINLVENLLSISRIDNGTLAIDQRPELMEDVIQEALRHINRGGAAYHIESSLEDDMLLAKMDARLIVQVLINIIDNAIKYTPPGSGIIISARKAETRVLIEIADDGPGIPEAAKPRLFDMFYTVDNARADGRRGLGLGLFLCKCIVGAHGGEIYVRDNAPHGTVFGFTLPGTEVSTGE